MNIKKLLFACIVLLCSGTARAYEYVDLGLPSGTLWATTNIGASTSTAWGSYFMWGDVSTSTSNKYLTSVTTGTGYDKETICTLHKYNTDSQYGTVDNKTVLETADDAAYKLWGSTWCIPTKEQWEELFTYCTRAVTKVGTSPEYGGLYIITFTGPNGKTIVIPEAGYYGSSENKITPGLFSYWSSSLNESKPLNAYATNPNHPSGTQNYYREDKLPIRPVSTKVNTVRTFTYPTSTPSSPFAGGSGTPTSPYLISTAQQLANLAYLTNTGNSTYCKKYYKLTADIDLGNNVWTPIGNTSSNPFLGEFNGDGHKVYGLYILNTSSSYALGLFGYTGIGSYCQIWNTNVVGNVAGKNYVGALVGYAENTGVYVCANGGGTVKGTTDVGGLVGYFKGGSYNIFAGYNESTIKGTTDVGGIVGNIVSGDIYFGAFNKGSVTGSTNVGAIVGKKTPTTTYEDCYYLSGTASKGIGSESTESCRSVSTTECSSGWLGLCLGDAEMSGFNYCYWKQIIGTDNYPKLNFSYSRTNNGSNVDRVYAYYTHSNSSPSGYTNSTSGVHNDFPSTLNCYHDESYTMTPTWTGTSSCSVKEVCSVCGKTETQTATITSAVTTAATTTSTGVRTYTAKVTTAGGRVYTTTKTEVIPVVRPDAGRKLVDLGLPSGTQWADINIGASSETAYGYYFAWGETSVKSTYSQSNYKYASGITSEGQWEASKLTKYYSGDSKTTLDLSDDAAYVNWGSTWRVPTVAQFKELAENCTWTKEGSGYRATGPNGNSIYLPLAGYKYDGNGFSGTHEGGQAGNYWANSISSGYTAGNEFGVVGAGNSAMSRFYGFTIRPVSTTIATHTKVTAITISGSTTVNTGSTITLTASVTPTNATDKRVSWKSSNTSVATISDEGVVTGIAAGSVTITATAKDGSDVSKTYIVTVKQLVTGVSLNATSATLWVGKTQTLTATISPSTANNKNVTWTSSNTSVATVSTSGVITAKAKGTATITATAADGSGKKATCSVTVKQQVTGITLNSTTLALTKGKTSTLTATATPTTANNTAVAWSSSNTAVATVSSSGVVTAVKTGTATITCTASDGYGTKTTCAVTVTNPVTSISLNATSATLWVNATKTLSVTYSPSDADSRSVTWASSNTSVATVSTSGVVTAKAKGTATITATSANGKTATCAITVNQQVTGITLNNTTLSLAKGATSTLTTTIAPTNASNTAVTWSSSNTAVATVSTAGVVTAVKTGTATITCTAKDGQGAKATCAVTVTTPVSGVTISKSTTTITIGGTETLTASTNSDADNKSITWSSSDETIATVSSTGVVTAVKVGKATITATSAADNTKKATCTVKVANLAVDGIYYKVIDATNKKAAVTYATTDYNSYSGDVVLPEKVTIDGVEYDVTEIGEYAFCKSTGLTSIKIPNSIEKFGTYAFNGCSSSSFKAVYIEDLAKWCNIDVASKAQANPTTIAHNLYLNNELIVDLIIPEGVTIVKYRTFDGCTAIKTVRCPNSLTTLNNCAFANANNIDKVYMGSGFNKINYTPFSKVNDLYLNSTTPPTMGTLPSTTKVHVYSNVLAAYQADSKWSAYTLTDDFDNPSAGSLSTIVGTNPTSLKVSGDLNGTDIKYLRSLINDHSLTSLDMSAANIVAGGESYDGTYSTVDNQIYKYMFKSCANLKTIYLPGTITRIEWGAFHSCTNLSTVNIPEGVTAIGGYAFQGCSSLTTIEMPQSLQGIGDGAFCYATGLVSVTIPKNVSYIGVHPFGYAKKLTEILVEEDNNYYTSIDGVLYTKQRTKLIQYPFAKGSNYVVPEGTTVIAQLAFDGVNLETVDLPSTINNIGQNAFRHCTSLKSLICRATAVETTYASAFSELTPASVTLKVPYASLSIYRAADVWKNFGTITSIEGYAEKTTISAETGKIVEKKTLTLTASTDVEGRGVVWTTSDSKVATVANGVVTAVGGGTATITATANDGGKAAASCTVTVIARGDVNGDGTIDNADITADVKFIMGDTDVTNLYADAADYNNNGKVTSTDAIAIVRLALTEKTTLEAKAARAKGATASHNNLLAIDDIVMESGTTKDVAIRLADTTEKFTNLMFDVTLPDGITIDNVTIGSRAVDHSAVYSQHDDGTVRVICYSLSNEDYSSTDGDIVKLTLKADKDVFDGVYDINFSNIKLVRKDVSSVVSDAENITLNIGGTTGMRSYNIGDNKMSATYHDGYLTIQAYEDGIATVHAASGALVYKNKLHAGEKVKVSVPRGIYIINGTKTAIK